MGSSLEGSNLEPITISPNKHDPGWKHCQLFVKNEETANGVNRIELKKCLYCGKMFQGGGIHRFKEHLAGRRGNGPICDRVPEDVRLQIQKNLDNSLVKKQKKNQTCGLSEVDNSCVNQEQCKSIGSGTPVSNFSGDRDDVGLSSLSVENVDRRMRGALRNSFAAAAACADTVVNGFEFSDNLVSNHSEVGHTSAHNSSLRSTGLANSNVLFSQEEDLGMSNINAERRMRLRDTNSSLENPFASAAKNGNESSDIPSAAIPRENVNSFAEQTQRRLFSFPSSSHLVNQEEVGMGNASVSKKKRLIDENFYAGEDAGIVSNDSELERANNKQTQVAIGRFLYEIAVPLDAVRDSVFFQPMIDAIASGGSVVVAPSYHDLRGWILKDVVEEVRNDVDWCTTRWAKTGCSLLVSECNSENGRTLLKFSVYCPERTMFLKSVDVSNILHSPDALHDLLKQVVEEVGVQHVLQVITNSYERYVVAGKRLMESLPNLYWSPCAAHCIGLILEDFGKIEWIKSAIEQARSVTRFIYKHTVILNIMRRYTFGIDIVKPGEFLSVTNFMTLKQIADLKLNLQSMVTSQEWMGSSYSNTVEGLMLVDTLTNRSFWSLCILITRLVDPLLRVLSIVSSQKRAAMGFVFAGIYRAKEIIKRELHKKEDYMVYWNIIDHRWKRWWHIPLHTAGFYLNPKFFYSIVGDMHSNVMSGLFDCIERLVSDIEVQDRIAKEINFYRDAVGDLGRKLAIRARDTLLPAEWWSTYGGGCPVLARFAVRILSQTCCLVHKKSNQISFEQLNETKNRIEHQRLNDLAFVQYNLQLRQMAHKSKVQDADPLSFDRKSVVEDWIMEKEINIQENRCADWMSLDPPSINLMLLELSADEPEDLRAGFDDHEIFNGLKEVKEEVMNIM